MVMTSNSRPTRIFLLYALPMLSLRRHNNAGFTFRAERSICRLHGMVDSIDHADASTPRRGVFHPSFLGGRQIECVAEIKGSHRVVSSGGPGDSDVEVHPFSEALLSVVIMLVAV